MKTSAPQVNIFLIHSHRDRDTVHKLYHRLVRDGVDAWLDAKNLQPGQDWRNEIRKALLGSRVVVVCLSRGFNDPQGYRHEELKMALEKARLLLDGEVFIIPVRLEPCDMPESLQYLQRVDLFEKGGYRRLVRALKGSVGVK